MEKKTVRVMETHDSVEFESFADAMIKEGYIMQSSSCSFIPSETYNFSAVWMAIFVKKECF